jgi:hypothetical protein
VGYGLHNKTRGLPRLFTTRKYADYIDPDSLILQLSELNDDEIQLPLDENYTLLSALHTIASTDAIICSLCDDSDPDPLIEEPVICSLRDDDASDPLSIPEA